jgi:hypothetical protein
MDNDVGLTGGDPLFFGAIAIEAVGTDSASITPPKPEQILFVL